MLYGWLLSWWWYHLPYCCEPNETCCKGDCCDPNKCETCVDGECKVCGGDPNKVCCDDGSCAKPCELDANTATCSGATQPCANCFHYCETSFKIVYTGNSVYTCKEPGCPGDCQDADPVRCYSKIPCKTNGIHDAFCGPGGWCWAMQGFPTVWCYQCIPTNEDIEDFNEPSKKCGP